MVGWYLVYFTLWWLWHNKLVSRLHICSNDKPRSFMRIQCGKADVSSLWGMLHRVFLCQKFLHAYNCRNSQKVQLLGHKVSLYWPRSSSLLDALNFWEVCCDSVGADPLWCFSWESVVCNLHPKIFMGLGFCCLCHELLNLVLKHSVYPDFCQDAEKKHFSRCF